MKLWKDLLIGVVAGVAAAGAMGLRRPKVEVPQGIYQAQLELPAHRELEAALRGGAGGTGAAAKRLQQKVEKFDVADGALDAMLSYIGDAAGVQVAPEWGVLAEAGVPRNALVSVRFPGGTAADALRAVLKAVPPGKALAFQVEGDKVRVSTYDELSKEAFTRVYDVRDIVRGVLAVDRSLHAPRVPPGVPAEKWPRPDPRLFNGPLGFADFSTTPADAVDGLVREIQSIVDPPSWRDAGGSVGRVQYFAGQLVVTQTRGNHDHVGAVLEVMREAVGSRP